MDTVATCIYLYMYCVSIIFGLIMNHWQLTDKNGIIIKATGSLD